MSEEKRLGPGFGAKLTRVKRLLNQIKNGNDHQSEGQEVTFLRENVKERSNTILENQDFKDIVLYLRQNYHSLFQGNGELTRDEKSIRALLRNPIFISNIHKMVSEGLEKIEKDSTNAFEEISFLVFLLGKGEVNTILPDLNHIDNNELGKLFDVFLKKIFSRAYAENKQLAFTSFTSLFELINKLLILNQSDPERKKKIDSTVVVLKEKLNKLLEGKEKNGVIDPNLVNNNKGRLVINFEITKFVEIEGKKSSEIISGFSNLIKNTINGYNISLNAFFGLKDQFTKGYAEKEKIYQKIVFGNVYYLLCTLIKILKNKFPNENESTIINSPEFRGLLDNITAPFGNIINKNQINSFQDLTDKGLKVILGIYSDDIKPKRRTRPGTSLDNQVSSVLNHFLKSNLSEISIYQMESLYNTLMFYSGFNIEKILKIGNHLLNQDNSKELKNSENYAYESLKMKIIELIINKLDHSIPPSDEVMLFLNGVSNYIEKNNIASQEIKLYQKVLLDIANYYSYFDEPKFYKLSVNAFVKVFRMYQNFGDVNLGIDLSQYKLRIGIMGAKYLGFLDENMSDESTHEKSEHNRFSADKLIHSGEKILLFELSKYQEQKGDLLSAGLQRIIQEISTVPVSIDEEKAKMYEKIGERISDLFFYGVAKCSIVENNNSTYQSENGQNYFEVLLSSDLKLVIKFPKVVFGNMTQIIEKEDYNRELVSKLMSIDENNIGTENSNWIQIVGMLGGLKDEEIDGLITQAHNTKNKKQLKRKLINTVKLKNLKNMLRTVLDSYHGIRDQKIDRNTGLWNERRFIDYLDSEEKRLNEKSTSTPPGALLLNFDHLIDQTAEFKEKYINEYVKLLEGILGTRSNIYRYNGTKIGVILLGEQNNDEFVNELLAILKSLGNIKVNNRDYGTSFLSYYVIGAREGIFKNIQDGSVYFFQQKTSGSYKEYSKRQEEIKKRDEILAKITKSVNENGINIVFQPIVNLQTGKVVKVEVLSRIKDIISSDEIWELIKTDSSLKTEITMQVLRKSLDFLKENPTLNVSINLFGDDFMNLDMLNNIKTLVGEFGVNPNRITFEALETDWGDNETNSKIFNGIKVLLDSGFNIAVDDYGKSKANISIPSILYRMIDNNPNYRGRITIKFDREITSSIKYNKGVIIGTVYDADAFGLFVVLEGVESIEEARFCYENGILVQGYGIGKPMDPEDFLNFKLNETFLNEVRKK